MSKFVTYPAVTVLDNDHTLLIDSPSAGTNSITADNAADTLLSKWAGFETFDEAVQNTISNNQEFIDRDTAIRSETADLKRKIVTTFPAKDASGAVATFESEFEDAPLKSCIVQIEPVQDLHGYDHPWPAGGGKNKFPGASEVGGNYSLYGLTWIPQEDGGMKISGTVNTATWLYKDRYIAFENFYGFSHGDTIAVSGKDTAGDYMTLVQFYNGSTFLKSIMNGYSATIPEETTRVRILFYPKGSAPGVVGEVINNTVYMQLELGSTATAYEPYSNECPISGWTGCKIVRANANIWDDDWYALGNVMSLITDETNDFYGYYTGSVAKWDKAQTKNGNMMLFPNGVDELTVILDAGNISGTGTFTFRIFFRYTDGTEDYNGGNASYSALEKRIVKRVSTSGKKCTGFRISTSAGENNLKGVVRSVMVSVTGETDIVEPQRTTYPITFPTSAGTVYGGYVDVINGKLVVDRAIVDLGTLAIKEFVDTGVTDHLYFVTLPDRLPYYAGNDPVYLKCSGLKSLGIVRPISFLKVLEVNTVAIRSTYTDRVYIKSEIETVEAMKQSLDGVQLVYPLAEPIHYPITPIDIKTLLGVNNIWADTGDTAVEYLISDVSWYVEKKLRAFQSVLAGVEDSSTASKNYSTDSYLIFNDDIYRVTKTITAGETIEDGVNVTKTTVAEQLMALAQA